MEDEPFYPPGALAGAAVGPVEATALGNVLVQAMALGHLAGLTDARAPGGPFLPIGNVPPARHGCLG